MFIKIDTMSGISVINVDHIIRIYLDLLQSPESNRTYIKMVDSTTIYISESEYKRITQAIGVI